LLWLFWRRGSHFLPRVAWTVVLLFYTSCHSWDDSHVLLCPAIGWDGLFAQAGLELQFSQPQPPK
jgi:hypothetical protein